MKNLIPLLVFLFCSQFMSPICAQYCGGSSGSNICTASSSFNTEGFQPGQDSLPCIIVGQAYSQVIQFHTPTNVAINGNSNTLNYLKVDTISNLPCGMCWAMGESNFRINGNATGCIKISGTTFDAPGEYLLHIIVDENVTPIIIPQTFTNINLATQGLTYRVRVQLPNDTCMRIDTTITGNTASHAGTLATPTITGSATLCPAATNTLTATGSNIYAYAWSTGSFNQSISVTAPGTYTVTVYGECTSATASKTVTALTVSDTITASGATAFCQGGNVTLNVPAGSAAYRWSTGATTNSINVTATGNYIVTVTGNNGCSAASSGVNVTVHALPADTIVVYGSPSFCTGGSVTLTGPAGLTYQWSNSATTRSITVTQAGNYALIVTDANNCSAVSSPVTVTTYALPNDTITAGGPTSFCTGGSVGLSGASGLNYKWSTNATTQSITVNQSGSYTLTVTNANNCSAISSPVTVTVNGAPLDVIYANGPLTFCAGDSVVITANPGVNGLNYLWSNGATTQSVTLTQSGSYTVTVTNSNNCTIASPASVVTVNPLPSTTVTVTGSTSICSGGHVIFTAAAGLTYRWSNNATTQSITVTQAGNYSVTVVNSNSCSAASTPIAVTVGTNPNDTVTVSGPTTFCSGGTVTLTAAAGLSYSWSNSATSQSIVVSQTGNYTVTVTNSNNCTAVSTAVHVTVNPSPPATVTPGGPTTFCSGGSVILSAPSGLSYLWSNSATTQNISVTATGTYKVTVTSGNQCTAVSNPVSVVVNSSTVISAQPVSQVSCINGSVTFGVTASGDSITYQWQKNGANISGQTGPTYTIATAQLADTGNYRVIIKGGCGTDTSVNAILTVAANLTFSQQPQSQVICLGSGATLTVVANGGNTTFQWKKNGQNISNATSASYHISSVSASDTGYYTCYVTSSCGNATSDSAKISISLPSSYSFSQSICAGSQYNFNGRMLTAAGTYIDTLTNHNNCDSIVTLTLSVMAAPTHSVSDSVCAGSAYNFYGQSLTSAGTYYDTLINGHGCDSIIILHLSLKQVVSNSISATICQGGVYNFNGQALTAGGIYRDTLTRANGCDSIVTLHLTVNPNSASTLNVAVCPNQSYNFNGHILTTAGTYTDTLTNALGCDSFVTLHLAHVTTLTYGYSATICAGHTYNFNGHILTATGSYSDTLTSAGGCDSIVTVSLTVNPVSASAYSASVCSGHTYNFGGHTLSTTGIYNDTLTNRYGCDSIVTLHLTVDSAIVTNLSAFICNGSGYLFNGQQLTTSGTYTASYTAQGGCDSTVNLNLTVKAFLTDTINAAICAGSTYNFNNHVLNHAGRYNDTLMAQGGCDSIITLNLSVNQAATGVLRAYMCTGGSYYYNGHNYTAPGTYADTLTGANGCDSIITLILQTAPALSTSISAAVCQGSSYNFNGQSLTASGTYRDTLTAAGGCDSIVTLTLTVNTSSDTTLHVLICAGSTYLFNGVHIGATGTYFEALTNVNGCDSIVRLELTVNTLLTVNPTVHICYGTSYNFNGQVLNATGVYTDTLVAAGGCDSVVNLNLIVNPLVQTFINDTICTGGVVHFNGQSITQGGTYTDTLHSVTGCDSIVTLNLNIKPHSTDTVIVHASKTAFCPGDSAQLCATPGYIIYNWSSHDTSTCFYTGVTGSYVVTVTDNAGCSAVSAPAAITVFNHIPVSIHQTGDTLTSTAEASYQWYFNSQILAGDTSQTIIALHTGNYSVDITDTNGCTYSSSVILVNTGISDNAMGYGVKLYPNPNTGYFTIQFTDDETREIEITDATGRMIVQATRVEKQKAFNLDWLAAGIYILNIRQDNQTRTLKFSILK